MTAAQRYQIPPEQLRWSLEPERLGLTTTEDVDPSSTTPGQHRALRSLEIGLGLRSPGYNVFLAGEPGSHRSETLEKLLAEREDPDFVPEDFCYVYNFHDPDIPRLLRFPAGEGVRFRDAMSDVVGRLRRGISSLLGSDVYSKRRRARVKRFSSRVEHLAVPLRVKAEPEGLSLVQVQIGDHSEAELLPVINGEPVAFEDLEALVERDEFSKADLQRLLKSRQALESDLQKFSEAADQLANEAVRDMSELDREITRPYVNAVLSGVHREFHRIEGVREFLHEAEQFLEQNIGQFRPDPSDEDEEDEERRDTARKLMVNLILDNGKTSRRPVIIEQNPTPANLRGTIDREVGTGGRVISDFTHIKAGSLLRAHGGYLVLHADDLEGDGSGTWGWIKRTLRTRLLRIEAEGTDQNYGVRTLRPEAIPVDVKVLIIGTPDLYQVLIDADPDFSKLFKIKVEFDSEMELSPQSITEYACLIRSACDRESLPHFSADGVAAVVEHGVRLAGHRNRITTQYSQIEDLVRESAFWCRQREASLIEGRDVHRALDERRHRVNLLEEKTQRLIREGTILIDSEGAHVGQINGLTVLDLGNHTFGRPTRITASAGVGSSGIINIERQAELSGSYHNKGLLILSGFLEETFATRHPIAISARITLEQSYSEVDGDSATLAETLALLSALSQVPLRQDIAVTGSMNQKGQIQPVGGVNEKIAGFFDLCEARGLTGDQGVLIPTSNTPNLMLRPAIVEAVRRGKFHVWAIQSLGEGVELMTGLVAGVRNDEGFFPEESLYGRVESRLGEMSRAARDFLPWG